MASLLHAINEHRLWLAEYSGNYPHGRTKLMDHYGFVVATAVEPTSPAGLAGGLDAGGLFLGSIAGFTFTSALCGIAGGFVRLPRTAGVRQRAAADLQAIMLDTYPRRLHGFAMSIWSLGMIMDRSLPTMAPCSPSITAGVTSSDQYPNGGSRFRRDFVYPSGVKCANKR